MRDLPTAGRPVTLLWIKRLWRCAEPACSGRTWSEVSEQIRPRASLTERARREACRLVGEDGLDVAAVAAQLGVGWSTRDARGAGLRATAHRRPRPARRGAGRGRGRDHVPAARAGARRGSSPASWPCPAPRPGACQIVCVGAVVRAWGRRLGREHAMTVTDDRPGDGEGWGPPGRLTGRQLREQLADEGWLDELVDRAGQSGVQ
ncbi:MAG: hypothetical protein M3Q22_16935, partial [Actinomycetota bacterium]|nr:hypothetical protein [Actinomycetota bacterium]